MKQISSLKNRQARLIKGIATMLDSFLIGTIARSPSMTGHNLTTKVKGKTVTLSVRKEIVPQALKMSKRYKKLWIAIQKLSKTNLEILKLRNAK